MFRFGTGFGLLECPLSEFNDDIHGEDNKHITVQSDNLWVEDDEIEMQRKEKDKIEFKKLTKKKKLKFKESTFEVELNMER